MFVWHLPLLRSLALFVLAAGTLASCGKPEDLPVQEHFQQLVGEWEGTHRVMGNEHEYEARYTISMEGEVLVHAFASEWDGGFTGYERMSISPDGELIAVWTDSGSEEASESRGSWDGVERVLTMIGSGESLLEPGTQVEYRHTTKYGRGSMAYTMTVVEADGSTQKLMWINMKKKD